MRLSLLSALGAFAQVVSAFSDTSPFFLFSSSELLVPSEPSIQSASSLSKALESSLSQCPSRTYLLVSQEGVNSTYYAESRWTPSLARLMTGKDKAIRSIINVPDIVGHVDTANLASVISERCGAEQEQVDVDDDGQFTASISDKTQPRILKIQFAAPTSDEYVFRSRKLLENDGMLSSVLETLPNKNYTVIYTTTPPPKSAFSPSTDRLQQEPPTYEWPDQAALLSDDVAPHMDLKRSVSDPHHRRRANETGNLALPSGPLFNRYQYLTPGLFMGFLVAFPLLLILYVAISAVASLQVSYGAFEKESGPQSSQVNKKAQ